MEYEFRRNTMTGTVIANFSMDHEVLGFWFVEELGECKDKFNELKLIIEQLQVGSLIERRWLGKALSLELDSEQVRVFANELDDGLDHEFEDDMSLYNGESEAFCGLEDFQSALLSWREFLDETR
ncbi:YacL family protein [Shewanella sp.]|uniref:YacL family protein n=1 Tax=Shewanella sp. TaxID=50422 RepID=UPI001ED1F885|nr:YacL family protein [Shewanella sp.]NRB24532.1 YacL family protein [Shewanella sp.]